MKNILQEMTNRYGVTLNKILLATIIASVASLLLHSLVVMLIWNYLMTDLFNLKAITYIQAIWMFVFSNIIFKTRINNNDSYFDSYFDSDSDSDSSKQ
jgi:hypothetical protein